MKMFFPYVTFFLGCHTTYNQTREENIYVEAYVCSKNRKDSNLMHKFIIAVKPPDMTPIKTSSDWLKLASTGCDRS